MSAIDAQLDSLDKHLDGLMASLLADAPDVVFQQGSSLHQAALAMGRLRADSLAPAQQQRLQRSVERLGQIRANLSRRAATVDRELAILLPQARPATYNAINPSALAKRYRA